MENRGKTAEDLHVWLTQRMHFRPQGQHRGTKVLRPEDFKFVCRGRMNDIWQYVVDHIHTAQTVRKVKGNLALRDSKPALSGYKVSYRSDKAFNCEREELLEKRRGLSSELTAMTSSVCEVKRELKKVREEIVAKEQSYQLAAEKIHDTERKRALLNAALQHTNDEVAKLNKYLTCLHEKADHLQKLMKRNQEQLQMFPKRVDSCKGRELGMESSSTRDVREACVKISSFLGQVIQGSFEGDKSQEEKVHGELWEEMNKILNNYSSDQLMAAVCSYTLDTVTSLQDKTAAIDIRKDAEILRFKYESGGKLSDASCPPTVLQTVHQLLEESQRANFARFLDMERALNKAWKLQKPLTQLSEQSEKLLMTRYQGNPGALGLARSILTAEASVLSSKAALKFLKETSDQLKENASVMSHEKQILFAKYQKIQDFKHIADSKQDLIRVLIKQNMNSREKIQKDQSELLKYAERVSSAENGVMSQLTKQLRDGVLQEVDSFVKLPIPRLLMTTLVSGDRVAVIDFSINKLNGGPEITGNHTIQTLLKTLEFPEYKGSECLLEHIVSRLTEAMESNLRLKTTEWRQVLDNDNQLKSKISGLCDAVNESDRVQVERLLPSVQKRLGDATHGLTTCLQVKDLALCWWEQPAQNCTPWITVDGLNLQQWQEKWIVAATQLRHLSHPAHK